MLAIVVDDAVRVVIQGPDVVELLEVLGRVGGQDAHHLEEIEHDGSSELLEVVDTVDGPFGVDGLLRGCEGLAVGWVELFDSFILKGTR